HETLLYQHVSPAKSGKEPEQAADETVRRWTCPTPAPLLRHRGPHREGAERGAGINTIAGAGEALWLIQLPPSMPAWGIMIKHFAGSTWLTKRAMDLLSR